MSFNLIIRDIIFKNGYPMTRILKNKTNKVPKETEAKALKRSSSSKNVSDIDENKAVSVNKSLKESLSGVKQIEEIQFNPINGTGFQERRNRGSSDCSGLSFHFQKYKSVLDEKTLDTLSLKAEVSISNRFFPDRPSDDDLLQLKGLKNLEPEELSFFRLREADDRADILMYNDERLFQFFRDQEPVLGDYVSRQPELTHKARAMLVDWLVGVHRSLDLAPETLFLAVDLVDRFLSRKLISVNKIQLVGTTALLLASKFEEIVVPNIDTFISISGSNELELKRAEKYMLRELDYTINPVLTLNFIRRCSKTDNYDIKTRTLAKYLAELTMHDSRLLDMPKSLVAVSCFFLSAKILQTDVNPNLFFVYSTYSKKDVVGCAKCIMRMLRCEDVYPNVKEKYSSDGFLKVSGFMERYCEVHLKKKGNK